MFTAASREAAMLPKFVGRSLKGFYSGAGKAFFLSVAGSSSAVFFFWSDASPKFYFFFPPNPGKNNRVRASLSAGCR